jgi:hypothetical protein
MRKLLAKMKERGERQGKARPQKLKYHDDTLKKPKLSWRK